MKKFNVWIGGLGNFVINADDAAHALKKIAATAKRICRTQKASGPLPQYKVIGEVSAFSVRQPIGTGNNRNGIVIDRYNTAAEAFAAIEAEQKKLRKKAGQQKSWVDRYVWDEASEESVSQHQG